MRMIKGNSGNEDDENDVEHSEGGVQVSSMRMI